MDRPAIWILFSLIFAYGCVRIPIDEANCQMMEPPCVETGEILTGGDFPDPSWWQMFQDPQLSSLIERALCDSPTLAKVAARVRAAEAQASIELSRMFPTVGLDGSIYYQKLGKYNFDRAFAPKLFPAHIDDYNLTFDISYELDFWGKNRNLYRSALGEAKAEMAEQQNAILLLTASVATAYFNLQAEMQQLDLLKEQREILSRLVTLTQTREENGIDSTTEVLATDTQLLQLDQSIQFSSQRVQLARHLLNQLIGQGPNLCEEIETIELNTKIAFPLPCEISSELLARRPDLMAQIWRIEAAAHQVGAAKAEFFPRIDLLAILGLSGVFSDHFFSWGSRLRQVMPALHLPIFTAGRLRANLRQRRAEFEEMISIYNESVLRAVQQVADQIVVLKTTGENLKSESTVLQNKAQNKNLAYVRYKNGVESLSGYLDSEASLLQERQYSIALQVQQRTAVVQLIRALGGGYRTEEVPLGCQ